MRTNQCTNGTCGRCEGCATFADDGSAARTQRSVELIAVLRLIAEPTHHAEHPENEHAICGTCGQVRWPNGACSCPWDEVSR